MAVIMQARTVYRIYTGSSLENCARRSEFIKSKWSLPSYQFVKNVQICFCYNNNEYNFVIDSRLILAKDDGISARITVRFLCLLQWRFRRRINVPVQAQLYIALVKFLCKKKKEDKKKIHPLEEVVGTPGLTSSTNK